MQHLTVWFRAKYRRGSGDCNKNLKWKDGWYPQNYGVFRRHFISLRIVLQAGEGQYCGLSGETVKRPSELISSVSSTFLCEDEIWNMFIRSCLYLFRHSKDTVWFGHRQTPFLGYRGTIQWFPNPTCVALDLNVNWILSWYNDRDFRKTANNYMI